jgi:hypothetical protein
MYVARLKKFSLQKKLTRFWLQKLGNKSIRIFRADIY